MEVPAVQVRNVRKSYKSTFNLLNGGRTDVLRGLDMTVEQGTIYGLLGPSGCGKTSLLKCIVGQMRVECGTVLVFGHVTGTKASGIPGRRVGYMPQDIALNRDLNIVEILSFYGNLMGMTSSEIKAKIAFLTTLLDLTSPGSLIDTLSGGQQRRVSLAVALVHDPELIILDEPTVGVDPILRKRIWNHLFGLTHNKQTILITTHYIEEARMAHAIGMMSSGVIICEGCPDEVIERHECASLEAVFLKLCLEQEKSGTEKAHGSPCSISAVSPSGGNVIEMQSTRSRSCDVENQRNVDTDLPRISFVTKFDAGFRCPNFNHVCAVTVCDLKKLNRNMGNIFAVVVVPCLVLIVYHLALGGMPNNISLAVLNEDIEGYGATYLSFIDKHTIILRHVSSFEEGHMAVKNGEVWGLLHIRSHFSTAVIDRFLHGYNADNDTVFHSTMTLEMDVTCKPISFIITETLFDSFLQFGRTIIVKSGFDPLLIALPFTFRYDVYERDTHGLMGYAISGAILCCLFFISVCHCIIVIFNEKSCGQMSRDTISGITPVELLLAHMTAFSVLVLAEVAVYMILAFCMLGVPCRGPIYIVLLIIFIHGLSGVAYGLFISSACNSEFMAVILAFGTFLPAVCLSGTLWPIEAVPVVLRHICYLLPQTHAVDGLRSVLKRSWELSYIDAGYGAINNIIWIAVLFSASSVCLSTHKIPWSRQKRKEDIISKSLPDESKHFDSESFSVKQHCSSSVKGFHCVDVPSRDMEVQNCAASVPLVANNFPVIVRNACKSYWQKKTENKVLDNLNLTIPQGTIYGLLGPSGCGKTTLLRCILGRLKLDNGVLLTLGQTPGIAQSDIPGPRIGYMPQEEALDGVLTIKELLYYYGRILGLDDKFIKKRTKFLVHFLRLPTKKRLFSTLSGGQKRRVSFAVALIHEAEFYILDEPTVGVDPILKQSIWDYLYKLVQTRMTTVLITTHYIEEARGANYVGMMLDGHLLAEDSPDRLIERYKMNTLEDVFLYVCSHHRCLLENSDATEGLSESRNPTTSPPLLESKQESLAFESMKNQSDIQEFMFPAKSNVQSKFRDYCPDVHWNKLNAIIRRNFIQLLRYPGFIVLMLVLPSFQIVVAGVVIGLDLITLNVGVVNNDAGNLSDTFLSLMNNGSIVLNYFTSWDDAYLAALKGTTYGVLTFHENFSTAVLESIKRAPFVDIHTLNASRVDVSLDGSVFVIVETIRIALANTYEKFIMAVLTGIGADTNVATLPIVLSEPVVGEMSTPHNAFIMPAFLTATSFFAQMGLSVIALFLDRDGGKLERIYVAGVTSFEIIFGFMFLQVTVAIAQTALMLFTALVIFEFSNDGSLILIILLTITQGICGVTLGLFLSVITDRFFTSAAGAALIIILSAAIGGFFWPLEAMWTIVRYICLALPFGLPANAMRRIMYHHGNLYNSEVVMGFGTSFVWTLAFLATTLITLRLRKGA